MHWMNWHGGGWPTMVLFWVLIILCVILLFKWISSKGTQSPTKESPIEILKKRYARGEITKEEFDRMKKDLQDNNP